jgi:hypothetical protein
MAGLPGLLFSTNFKEVSISGPKLRQKFGSIEDSRIADVLQFVSPGIELPAAFRFHVAPMGGEKDCWPVPLNALAGPPESHQLSAFDVHLDVVWRGNFFLLQERIESCRANDEIAILSQVSRRAIPCYTE